MASLTGTKIKDTYDSLLKVSDNGALDGTLQTITDGLGNNSALSLSTAGASVGGTLAVSGAATLSSTLAVTGNATFDTNTLFVDAANNRVGIGTNSPARVLDVVKSEFDLGVRVKSTSSTSRAGFYTEAQASGVPIQGLFGSFYDNAAVQMRSVTNHPLVFYTNNTEKMRITSNGTVLIGATDTSWTDTVGFYSFYQSATNITRDGAECMNLNRLTSDGSVLIFRKAGVSVGSVSVTGSATAYNTSSDYRLKEDWVAMEGALDRVDLLKPVNFAWKADGSRVDGFLAHELAEVVPEAVTGEKDATEIRSVEVSPAVYEDVIHPAEEAVYETIEHPAIAEELDEEGNILVEAQDAWTEEVLVSEAKEEWVEKVLVSEAVFEDQEFPVYQGIDQSKIVPLLVAAIQELRAELDALKQA